MGPFSRNGMVGMALLFAAIGLTPEPKPVLSGPARVIDAATLVVAGRTVWLTGLDAPEPGRICGRKTGRNEPCGRGAADALRQHIGDRPVECWGRSPAKGEALLATCRVGGNDLNAWLVRRGWARACRDGVETAERPRWLVPSCRRNR
ncbi:thermonuclease family protein [Phaeospirillum tilakii]|uniref:Thermonuclease family protein n=1 Tax=Phaeospirillum tilakii TaxID=741673 RepID=A0ABW5CGB6_9PROT